MSSILSMISLKDRLKQLFLEPTLDKAFTTFSTIMLGTFVVTLFTPLFSSTIQYELLLIQGVSCILSAIAGLLFKHFDQTAREASSERLKKEIEFDYLIKNPKLKETEIFMNQLEVYNDRLTVLCQLVETALNIKIKDNSEKYSDPLTATGSPPVPWEKDDTSHG